MDEKHLTRQQDIIPLACLGENITIIGAGAIGGWTALALAKMGFSNLMVIDFDDVSEENMNSQFYRLKDIGVPKVVALRELIREFTGVDIAFQYSRYMEGQPAFNGIVISAVDSMGARRFIWDRHKGNHGTKLLIDPRMGAESALLYAMRPTDEEDIKAYESTLYSDQEAVAERCTAKATMYTASLLSGLVCKAVKDFVTSGMRTPGISASTLSQEPSTGSHQTTGQRPLASSRPTLRIAQWDIGLNAVQLWNRRTTCQQTTTL